MVSGPGAVLWASCSPKRGKREGLENRAAWCRGQTGPRWLRRAPTPPSIIIYSGCHIVVDSTRALFILYSDFGRLYYGMIHRLTCLSQHKVFTLRHRPCQQKKSQYSITTRNQIALIHLFPHSVLWLKLRGR